MNSATAAGRTASTPARRAVLLWLLAAWEDGRLSYPARLDDVWPAVTVQVILRRFHDERLVDKVALNPRSVERHYVLTELGLTAARELTTEENKR